jgi:hypothetical protein
VAIVGNDAMLAAAPATPVQLAHACLRRGFTVAVPASWGDELVAAETIQRLIGRERGPAVMCVCPFVRSRLLAPGPDLAPFLVSLVAPSVAVARYVRAVYGDQAVHITYIGNCPAADDPAIDVSLTPDAFFADIAEHGIALSEQPLVFDSIVPPDRRRWCSVPGGVPSPEVLWNEADGRTLVEIDRDDASTDIAQHIITREHVLLDLAPGLGCACSGAVAPLAPRSARVAVTALEPPRAFAPVIDTATVVSLDAPVRTPAPPAATVTNPLPNAEPAPGSRTLVEDVLDQEIGTPLPDDVAARLVGLLAASEPLDAGAEQLELPTAVPQMPDAEVLAGPTTHAWREIHHRRPPSSGSDLTGPLDPDSPVDTAPGTTPQPTRPAAPVFDAEVAMRRHQEPAVVIVAESDIETLVDSPVDALDEDVPEPERDPESLESLEPPAELSSAAGAHVEPAGRVRRRAPASVSVRSSAATVPRTTASGGRSLPRAYVAKRRVPLSELTAERSVTTHTAVEPAATPATPDVEAPAAHHVPEPVRALAEATRGAARAAPLASPPLSTPGPDATGILPAPTPTVAPPNTADATDASAAPTPRGAADRQRPSTGDTTPRFSPPGDAAGPGPLVIVLLLALVGLTAFVIWTLSR